MALSAWMPWAEVYQRVQESVASALCSSSSCLPEPEAPVDFITQPAVGSLPGGVCSPQHIHRDSYWDDPSLQGGGRRPHCALSFEVTRHLTVGVLAILAPNWLVISGWGGRCEAKTLSTLQEQDVLARDYDWPNIEHSSWGNREHCKVCHWTVGCLFLHLCFLSSSTASRKTLVPVIYTLMRIEIHVSSHPSGFVFDVQCSLWKQASIIC